MTEKLEISLNSPVFFIRREKFVRKRQLEFPTCEEALEFFLLYLISECISGVNYTPAQLEHVHGEISSMPFPVSSEDLPLLEGAQKSLDNVIYHRFDNVCLIEEKPAS